MATKKAPSILIHFCHSSEGEHHQSTPNQQTEASSRKKPQYSLTGGLKGLLLLLKAHLGFKSLKTQPACCL